MRKIAVICIGIMLVLPAFNAPLWGNPHPVEWEMIDNSAPIRIGYKCAYESGTNQDPVDRIVLFGGQDTSGQMPNDIWYFSGFYDGFGWDQIEGSGPAGRIGHGLWYDTLGQNLFLFGD